MNLNGQIALVTGATGGLGDAIARSLHAHGATVLVTGRRAEILEKLVADLGERARAMPGDLSNAEDVARLAGEAGAVDLLVANAGVPATGKIEEYTPEQVDRALDVNLRAPVHLTNALLPGMLERRRGHLIYISSMSGKVASSSAALYNATKFGLRGFSLATHEDLRGTGVGCTCIFPGFIQDAGMWADSKVETPPGSGIRRPSDVADAVLKAIRKNPHEIDVAGPIPRLGAWLTGPAPSLVAAAQRAGGGEKVASELTESQRDKR